MKNLSKRLCILIVPFLFGVMGCGEKRDVHASHDGHANAEAGHDDHGSEASGATYQEGKGIRLSDETQKSLGLELVEVGEQDLQPVINLTAQVYRTASETSRTYGKERTGNAYATALVSKDILDQLAPGQKVTFLLKNKEASWHEGGVAKVDTTQLSVLGKGEALLELPDSQNSLAVGSFVETKIFLGKEVRKVMGIPHSAVLETSTGKYAFVKNGDFLLRTEIKTGSQNEEFMEINEGLYEGDTVVLKPTEALYLIELRATKGGGHCH